MNPQTTYTFIQACQPIPNFQIIHRNNIIEDLIRYADFIDASPFNTTHKNTKQLTPKK